ncbi:MAG: sigma-70 family RNA polymerase sigma factor [Propionibacteriales bacterium]|nr:sigma-70 family RNA polymerase sigma factor [Propionibacteriales bacterium]
MNPSPTTPAEPTEPDLLAAVRAGDLAAYAVLYERHRPAALRLAISIAGPTRAEDLVGDAFTNTLRQLLAGRGPEHAVGPYLQMAVRNAYRTSYRREKRVVLIDDFTDLEPAAAVDDPWHAQVENRLATRALASLPARWQQVLRLSTLERRPLDEVAAIMGTSTGAAAQLAHRAREALRLAYLAEHVRPPETEECRSMIPALARQARGNGTSRRARVEAHLGGCPPCRSAGTEISSVARTLHPAGRV